MLCKHCKKELNESQTIGEFKSCPSCSVNSIEQEHIFYPSGRDEDFKWTEKRKTKSNPTGIHSWCTPCRNKNIGPHPNGIKCSDMPPRSTNV